MAAQKRIVSSNSNRKSTLGADDVFIRGETGQAARFVSNDRRLSEPGETTAKRATRGFPSNLTRTGPFSFFIILLNQLFNDSGSEDERHASQIRQLLEASMPDSYLHETEPGERTIPYRHLLLEICSTVNSLSITQLDLDFVDRLQKDLAWVVDGLHETSNEKGLKYASTYNQLVNARKLLEIIVVLYEDIKGLDAIKRLVQRNQVFLHFKSNLQSIVQQWPEDETQNATDAFGDRNKFFVPAPESGYIRNEGNRFRNRLAGDRTTKLPPPPPPPPTEKNPPKEQEKGKADKPTRPSR